MRKPYMCVSIRVEDYALVESGVLLGALTEVDYDSFEEKEALGVVDAYVLSENFCQEQLDRIVGSFEGLSVLGVSQVEEKDWNAEWESRFAPLLLEFPRASVLVHASFHENLPQADYSIVVDPKMAFGTGHHATTAQVMGCISELDLKGSVCLDMGAGTGLLAIFAEKMGAAEVDAIDYDPWSYENIKENAARNRCLGIQPILGDFSMIPRGKGYDYIFANLTRNLLVEYMGNLFAPLKEGGRLILSGFYLSDLPDITAAAEGVGLRLETSRAQGEWTAAQYIK